MSQIFDRYASISAAIFLVLASQLKSKIPTMAVQMPANTSKT